MKAVLFGIVAVSLLFVLAEILIPEGQIKKYVTGILRLAFVAAIFVPLIKLLPNKTSDIDINADGGAGVASDETTLGYFSEARDRLCEKNIENDFLILGIKGVKANIVSYRNGEKYVVFAVAVDFSESGITGNEANIISIEEVKKVVLKRVDVAEELISVYGWN